MPGRRPRVLQLIKCLGYGGAEQLMVAFAAHRDRQAFDYEMAYVLAAEDALVPMVEATGVPVHALGARGNADLRWTAGLRRLLRRGEFNLVHLHLPYAAAVGRWVVRSLPPRRRPALVYTEHSIWGKAPLVLRALNRSAMGSDAGLIAVSAAAAAALPGSLRRRAVVVEHGIDQDATAALLARRRAVRAEVRAELGVRSGELLVMSVANLRPEKGYDVLLPAARRVLDAGSPVRFAAVGRGPLRAEVTAWHEALGLGDRFRLLGQRHDALRLLAGADLFVLASHHEGLPVTVMEATSLGLPIVSTAVGEMPALLGDERAGVVVPPGRPEALAAAIVRVVGDEALRARLAAASRACGEAFDVTRAVRRIEAMYRAVLARGR